MEQNFKPNDNFKYYMYFVSERMNIFWNKLYGGSTPYSKDKIFNEYKFTNVYRVLDRSSQYLVREIINKPDGYTNLELFWRILIYKHFNLPSTWEYLKENVGNIRGVADFSKIIECLLKNPNNIYSNAYMMTTAFVTKNSRYNYLMESVPKKRFKSTLHVFEKEIHDSGFVNDLLESKTYFELITKLNSITSLSNFLSYQYAQDFNYSRIFNFDDNEFCSAGDGTIRGIHRTFDIVGKPDYNEIVKWVQANFEKLCHDHRSDFRAIPGWLPTVPDFSNCFCETDKYMRGSGIVIEGVEGQRIKTKYTESSDKMEFVFPEKWGIPNL